MAFFAEYRAVVVDFLAAVAVAVPFHVGGGVAGEQCMVVICEAAGLQKFCDVIMG